MSEETKSVDEAILEELKALRAEVKLLREQAKMSIVVVPGTPYPVFVQQPVFVPTPVAIPWHTPTYVGCGLNY